MNDRENPASVIIPDPFPPNPMPPFPSPMPPGGSIGMQDIISLALIPYFLYLRGQGNPRSLQDRHKNILQKHYLRNLNFVSYYENINTVHGSAITIGDEIFFPRTVNFDNESDMGWLLHELEHVDQYVRAGGVSNFLWQYVGDAVVTMLKNFTFNPHDIMSMEIAAEKKSNDIICEVMADLNNQYFWKFDRADRFFVINNKYGNKRKGSLIAINHQKENIGIFQAFGTTKVVLVWKGNAWVNPPNSSGNTGWRIHPGDKFIPADIDGDGKDEIIVVSDNGAWIGIIKENNGVLNNLWTAHGRVGGWTLHKGDQFIAADINGDGKDEIIVFSGADGKFIGYMCEENGGLVTPFIVHASVGGWTFHKGDQFIAADINGDGKDEIIVFSGADGKFIGYMREENGKLVTPFAAHASVGGWTFHKGDQFIAADINGDGKDEIIVFSGADGKFIGYMREENGKLVTPFAAHASVGGWTFHKGDQFITADINGDGKDEIIVFSGADGKFIGYMREENEKLVTPFTSHGSVGGWTFHQGDQFVAADINGDGKEEVIVFSGGDGKFLGIIGEQNGELVVPSIEHNCVVGRQKPSSIVSLISPSSTSERIEDYQLNSTIRFFHKNPESLQNKSNSLIDNSMGERRPLAKL